MSRPLEGTSGRASGIAALLLQFRSTASSVEIRAGHADAGHAGGFNRKAADVTADLLFGNRPSGMVQSRVTCRVRLLRPPSFSVENGALQAA
jgi:hypothetical protein